MIRLNPVAAAAGLLCLASSAMAQTSFFSSFTPLAASAGPIPVNGAGEATPLTLSSALFSQRTIADRVTQKAPAVRPSMHVAILTFDGFNELDSFVAAAILNRLRRFAPAAIEDGVGGRDTRGRRCILAPHDADENTDRGSRVAPC